MVHAKNSALFVRLGSRPIPRVERMMVVARDLGLAPLFVGAYRENGLESHDTWNGWPIRRLGWGFPLLNGRRPWVYLWAVFLFNAALLRFLVRIRPVIVHASDIEVYPACWIYARCFRKRLLLNIHDNLAQRYRVPRLVGMWLNALEGMAIVGSDAAVVPEAFRREALPRWCQRRVSVIRNTPIDPGVTPPSSRSDRIRILMAGWIDWGRGLAALLRLAASSPGIELRIAGEGAPELVAEVRKERAVTYLGFLAHEEIIEEARRADFIVALYDPSRLINRYAAPNKLAEALAVGRPVIINREVRVAQALEAAGCSVPVNYGALDGLAQRLKALVDDKQRYREMCARARQLYEDQYSWTSVRAATLSVYRQIGFFPAPEIQDPGVAA